MCIDNTGYIHATGFYTGNVNIGDFHLPDSAEYNMFYTKLSSSGEILFSTFYDSNSDFCVPSQVITHPATLPDSETTHRPAFSFRQ